MSKGSRLRRARQAKRLEISRARDAAAEEGRARGCLICRQGDGGFSSVEHILPESIGNTEKILPVGVVCDRCNHGPLSQIDRALGGFLPIEMMRTWHGIPAKDGRLPAFTFDNGTMETRAPGHVHLLLDSSRDQPARPPAGSGKSGFSFSAKRMKDTTPRRLRDVQRALLKTVIEFAWLDMGEAEALSNKFDHVREKILGAKHEGYLVFPERVKVSEEIEIQYVERERVKDGHPVFGVAGSF
jgi:HNH endonuclease